MSFKYAKLSGRIKEKFKTQERFAEAMNMSPRSISLKLNNKREWKQNEIDKAHQAIYCLIIHLLTFDISPCPISLKLLGGIPRLLLLQV